MNRFAWAQIVASGLRDLVARLNRRMKALEYFLGNVARVNDTGTSAQQGYAFEAVFLQLDELSGDPSAPGTDKARLYSTDNGAGKTQLVVRFPTGAVQVLATEP